MWSGTAESWRDLHPAEATLSRAYDVYEGQQVGVAKINDVVRASLWNGTAESWTDLHPVGASNSSLRAVHDGLQVGYAELDGVRCAAIWSGSADSFEDLSSALPASWGETLAWDVWSHDSKIYVLGSGFNIDTGRTEALLWTRPATCRLDVNGDDSIDIRDITAFLNAWVTGSVSADWDGNGDVDSRDVLGFLNSWMVGC
jgi:hypothetical protein